MLFERDSGNLTNSKISKERGKSKTRRSGARFVLGNLSTTVSLSEGSQTPEEYMSSQSQRSVERKNNEEEPSPLEVMYILHPLSIQPGCLPLFRLNQSLLALPQTPRPNTESNQAYIVICYAIQFILSLTYRRSNLGDRSEGCTSVCHTLRHQADVIDTITFGPAQIDKPDSAIFDLSSSKGNQLID